MRIPQRVAPGCCRPQRGNGIGRARSKFSKKEFSEWMEFLWSVAADRGVVVYEKEAA